MEKRKKIIIFSIICGLILCWAFIFSLKKEPSYEKELIKNPVMDEVVKSANIAEFELPIFTGPEPKNIPTALPVLKLNIRNDYQIITNKARSYCGFIEKKGQFFIGNKCSYYLYHSNKKLEISTHSSGLDINKKIVLANAESAAKTFLSFLGPNVIKSIFLQSTEYLLGHLEYLDSSPDQANLILLEYGFSYHGVPIFSYEDASPNYVLLINSYNQVQRANLSTQTAEVVSEEGSKKILSINEALKNIANKQGVLLNVYETAEIDNKAKTLDISALKNIKFDTFLLEYRYKAESGEALAYPSYRFSGLALDKKGNEVKIEVITSAI